jgi:predicted lipoprotein with Yx(FWY)xxD motif
MMQQNSSWPGRGRIAAPWARRQAALRQGRHLRRMGWLAPAAMVAAALIVAGCGSSSPGSGGAASTPRAASSTALKTATISGATVLTNAKGLTLYSFAPDTMTTSKCNGNCANLWPPVQGPVAAGPRITGNLGTITRSDGSTQATYNAHPLYAYIGDTTPGQANGNGLNSSGGIWHEVTASGAAAPAASSGGGGSGY